MNTAEFYALHKLRCTIIPVAIRPDTRPDPEQRWVGAKHYRATFARRGIRGPADKAFTVYYSCGSACGIPDGPEILDSLALDATAGEDFNEWCADTDCNPDSIAMLRVWEACRKVREDLIGLLGEPLALQLMHDTERL